MLLLPDAVTGEIEADVFPRSAVMRFLFDSSKRRVAISALSTVAMLAGRGGLAKAQLASTLVRAARKFVGARRR
jgi:hypothetical protein